MPKRYFSKNSTDKVCKTSRSIGSSSLLSGIKDNADEVTVKKTQKGIRYIKSDQNNEVERLLLHNSLLLNTHVEHNTFPAFNASMFPQEDSGKLSIFPSCAFSIPRPVYVADKSCEEIDICFKRPMNRQSFATNLRFTRTTYQTAWKRNKNLRTSTKLDVHHHSIFDIAERIYMQPDPYFHSCYDYYFAGGNLSVLPHKGHIIHAGGQKLQDILASEFPVVNGCSDSSSLRNIASVKKSDNSELFEFHPLITSVENNQQNCFIARQRNIVTFNYLNECNQIKTVTQFRTKSTPFISFAQSDRDIKNFIMTTMKQHIRLYDLGSNVPALVKLFSISSDEPNISWNTVKSWRENTFLYANEKQFFMIDIRTSPEQWLKEVSLMDNSSKCDHITALMPSDFNNLFYLATNHKLHCMDVRLLKNSSLNDSEGCICRWTHQLRYAPLMIDTYRSLQTEYIALSSPIAGDLHICQMSRTRNVDNTSLEPTQRMHKHAYCSPCLPYQPPTLFEAYENARLSGQCLRTEGNMETRLKCCITGMKFLKPTMDPNSGIGLLLTSNSNGDVFAQTLSKRENNDTEERCNRQSDEIVKDFERKICNQLQMPINYTEIKDMKGLRKVFLCKSLSSVKKFDIDDTDSERNEDPAAVNYNEIPQKKARPKRLRLGRWQKPLSTLHSYKDALASDLLSIWDIDLEEETNIHLGNLRDSIKEDPLQKVDSWFKRNMNENPPMLSMPSQEMSRYIENDTSNIFDNTFNISQSQTTIDFENAVHSTQIVDNSVNNLEKADASCTGIQIDNGTSIIMVKQSKSKPKNKKYVKGF